MDEGSTDGITGISSQTRLFKAINNLITDTNIVYGGQIGVPTYIMAELVTIPIPDRDTRFVYNFFISFS